MKSLFSVIVPVYNVVPYLTECLDSVLGQTFDDWECLCADDGSIDGSSAILDGYARCDSRFRIIHQPNAGVSVARNRGLAILRGTWVMFLDGDDVLALSRMKVVAEAISENVGADWIRLGCTNWNGDTTLISTQKKYKLKSVERSPTGGVLLWGWERILQNGALVINVYRSSSLVAYRFPENLHMREDDVFMLGLLPGLHACVVCDDLGYYYRYREDSAFRKPQAIQDCFFFIEALNQLWKVHGRLLGVSGRRALAQKVSRFIEKAVVYWAANRKEAGREGLSILRRKCWAAWKSGAFCLRVLPWRRACRWILFLVGGGIRLLVPSAR